MSSAGMPPVYIYRKATDTIEEFQFEGMPLGTMNSFPYQVVEQKISSGDVILLLSDGMPELKNKKNEMYGYRKIKNSFLDIAPKESEDIINHLMEEGKNWVQGEDPDDDVTFVVIKVR